MTPHPVILITGASSGIGAACARMFSNEGYSVILAARRLERLQSLAGEIQTYGGSALPVETDVTDKDQVQALVDTSLNHFGKIDILLNNAGLGRMNWLECLDPENDITYQMQVNFSGVVHTTRAVLPHMKQRHQGHIVNMVSMAGLLGMPQFSIYAGSKFAVRGFTEALRREVKGWGIHVSGIYPGGVKTDFFEKSGLSREGGMRSPKILQVSPEKVAREVLCIANRPRRMVVIPRILWAAVWMNFLLPGLFDLVIEKRFNSIV